MRQAKNYTERHVLDDNIKHKSLRPNGATCLRYRYRGNIHPGQDAVANAAILGSSVVIGVVAEVLDQRIYVLLHLLS